jgi:hypothetical protein
MKTEDSGVSGDSLASDGHSADRLDCHRISAVPRAADTIDRQMVRVLGRRGQNFAGRNSSAPGYTARQIFHVQGDALPFIQELGVANIATGTGAVLSAMFPSFTLPLAAVGGMFYGIAGIRHVTDADKSRNPTIAMVSDLCIAALLLIFVIYRFQ